MTDKEQKPASAQPSSQGATTASQNNSQAPPATASKTKAAKKKKESTATGLAPNGAAIVESNTGGTATKGKKEGRDKKGGQNTLDHRMDYVCNFFNLAKDKVGEMTVLDFSLDDICRMDFIQHFINLRELTLNNQGIAMIEGVDRLKQLEKCWITGNLIDTIKCFDKLRNLRELYLGYNRITKTSGLEKCVMLEKLWIDANKVDSLVGLGTLERLESLNLAGNNIETIGIGLDGLVSLSTLNLAANKIGNFKEVLNLNRLPCLTVASFTDPHYGDNPICNLCNYTTYVLYHLPRLFRLDTDAISDDSKNFAEGTFMKKRMYYNMRIKTIQRNTSNIMKLLKICRKVRNFKIDIQVSKLTRRLNEVQRELDERLNLPQGNHDDFEKLLTYGPDRLKKNPLDLIETDQLVSDIDAKTALINGRLHDKNEDLKELSLIYDALRKRVYDMSEQNIHRLMTELETGGNIRFEEGKPTDKWYSSCVDLVRSRFNPDQMQFYGIKGIQVTRVTRIHNRFLRNRFEEKLEQLVDIADSSYKRNLEYLFYGVDPARPSEIYRAMEEGFRSQGEYFETPLPNCIPLVNSVASAEIARINAHFQGEDGFSTLNGRKKDKSVTARENQEFNVQKGYIQIPSGSLLVCKVYLSKLVQDVNYPHFNPSHSPSEIWRYAPVDTRIYSHVQTVFRTKENDSRQRLWFVFDNALVLPEYLVEFDYVINKSPLVDEKKLADAAYLNAECNKLFKGISETQRVLENTYIKYAQKNPRLQNVHLTIEDLDRSDMGCLKKNLYQIMCRYHIKELMENHYEFVEEDNAKTAVEDSIPPDIPLRSQLDSMNENIIRIVCREKNLANITYINLFNNKIKHMTGIASCINLKTLILAFNEIEEIGEVQECKHLQRLDLHNNFIRQVRNLTGSDALTHLDLTHNWIADEQQINIIKQSCKNLLELGLRCNPVASKKAYRAIVFNKMPDLKKLDGSSYSEKDKEREDMEMKALDQDMLFDAVKDVRKGLFEVPSAENSEDGLKDNSEDSPMPPSVKYQQLEHKPDWERQIEVLNLAHLGVSHIANLEQFINLKKLNLMDNNILKIAGLEQCKLLEELSLEKNKIMSIENLSHLKYLKKLDLGQNRIMSINNIKQLESLTQLSLEDNQISRLTGFEEMQTLMELYLGNNLIDDIKEIINLKELQRLIILDISGNNLIKVENYRIYCIYNLRRLRVLDGLSVENSECLEAKETFAGRLTQEILEQRLGGFTFHNIKQLDLDGCKLRDFDKMFDIEYCPSLRELNLNNNSFASLRGFGYLPNLMILNIKHNRLDSLFCKLNEDGYPRGLFGLHGLEVLDVSSNCLHDLYGLQLAPMKELKILHAANNEITKVDFLDKLRQLRELDLSKNRIRQIDANSFANHLIISCLKLEDNSLKSLANIERLERLQAFYGGGNRIAEFQEVDRLAELVYLMEISLQNNPMMRKPQYRTNIIRKLQNLIVLDGKEVTMEDRNRIETSNIYDASKAPPMIQYHYNNVKMPPVKLNAVNFDGVFNKLKYPTTMEQAQQVQAVPKQNFTGVQGLSISPEMNMMQVQGMNMQMQNLHLPGQMGNQGGDSQDPRAAAAQRFKMNSKQVIGTRQQPTAKASQLGVHQLGQGQHKQGPNV